LFSTIFTATISTIAAISTIIIVATIAVVTAATSTILTATISTITAISTIVIVATIAVVTAATSTIFTATISTIAAIWTIVIVATIATSSGRIVLTIDLRNIVEASSIQVRSRDRRVRVRGNCRGSLNGSGGKNESHGGTGSNLHVNDFLANGEVCVR
ncbi:MAG: hypothetical protein BYD32DRAFT_469499, partial [Podila humilis]